MGSCETNLYKVKPLGNGLAKTLRSMDVGVSTQMFFEALFKAYYTHQQYRKLKKIVDSVSKETGLSCEQLLTKNYHFNDHEVAVLYGIKGDF